MKSRKRAKKKKRRPVVIRKKQPEKPYSTLKETLGCAAILLSALLFIATVVEVIRYFEKRQASSRKAVLKSTGKATLYFKQVPVSWQFAKSFPTSRA